MEIYNLSNSFFVKYNSKTAVNILLVDGVLDGYGAVIPSLACPQYDGYDATIEGYTYDPDLARALLAEAGYADGFTMDLSYSQSTSDAANTMQFVASQLADVGITVNLIEMDSSSHRETIGAGTVEPLYLSSVGGPYANIDLQAKLVFSTGERYSTYSNPEFDALRELAASTVDQTERDALNSQVQQMILDEAAGVILYQSSAIYGLQSSLQNWEARADEMLLFYDCSVA